MKRIRDPQKMRAYYKVWRLRHPEDYRESRRRSNNTVNFDGLRYLVIARDAGCCVRCGATNDLTVDHIDRNRANNTMENFQTLCRPCHGRKDGQARQIKSGWHFTRRAA